MGSSNFILRETFARPVMSGSGSLAASRAPLLYKKRHSEIRNLRGAGSHSRRIVATQAGAGALSFAAEIRRSLNVIGIA
jgi:hypothetical protein